MSLDKNDLIIMPFSARAALVYHILVKRGKTILAFFDNNRQLDGSRYSDCQIILPEKIERKTQNVTIILCEPKYYIQMNNQLKHLGFVNTVFSENVITSKEAFDCFPLISISETRQLIPKQISKMKTQIRDSSNFLGTACILHFDDIFIPIIDIKLSEDCQLKCAYCAFLQELLGYAMKYKNDTKITDFFEWFDSYHLSNSATKDAESELFCLLTKGDIKDVILFIGQDIIGGSTYFLDRKLKKLLHKRVLIIRYKTRTNNYLLHYRHRENEFFFSFNTFSSIKNIISIFKIMTIYINALSGYPGIYSILTFLIKMNNEFGINYVFYLHDYYSICPSGALLDYDNSYCRLPSPEKCNECLVKNNNSWYLEYESIERWRVNWFSFLATCNQIIVFSDSSKKILSKVYPDLKKNIITKPHKVDYVTPVIKRKKNTNIINIGIIGTITLHKGSEIIKEMLSLIQEKSLPISITVFGIIHNIFSSSSLKVTGYYHTSFLPSLIENYGIDIILIPSICPETFSYTTQEAIALELPVAVFDIGAQAEKVSVYKEGLVIKDINAENALKDIISFIGEQS